MKKDIHPPYYPTAKVSCACGAAVTLEHLGRTGYDFVKVAGATLVREEFDRVALKLRAFDDYRAQISTELQGQSIAGKIVLRIYRSDGAGTEKLAQEIGELFSKELFVTQSQSLQDIVSKKLFLPLSVKWGQEPFPLKNKEIKLIEPDQQRIRGEAS